MSHAPSENSTPAAPRRTKRSVLHIQSKLLVMLLSVSLLATVIVGAVGYINGTDSLRDAAFQQVTNLRENRANELERTVETVQESVILDSRNASAVEATKQFADAFAELEDATVSDADRESVEAYYSDVFVPALEERSGQSSDPDLFLPRTNAQTYLQAHYTAPFDNYDDAILLDDAGDGSEWSAVHATYHDYFRELVLQSGYEDVLLLDTEGNVIYSAYGGVDLGTNVRSGPYAESGLATAFTEAIGTNSTDTAITVDFDRYQPSLDVPTGWIASPVGAEGTLEGVLAIQIPSGAINGVMTADGEWESQGLGATGEAYVAGPDKTMRSTSRELLQNPEQFEADVVAAGTSPEIAERQVAVGGSVLLQPTDTYAVTQALAGVTNTTVALDYRGKEVLEAYAPLDIDGLQWVIVAKIDTSEAFAPVQTFARNLLLSTVAIIILVSLLSLLLAQVFVRPLRKLQTAVNKVSAGDIGAEVPPRSGDEFGELGAAFNDMSRNLRVKQDLIDAQREEHDQLLLSRMPRALADRYKNGEQTISEDHKDVSVVFADIVGFEEFTEKLDSVETLALINGLWKSFDEAADRHGVERVRNTQRGYLASCGLTVPRVDNGRRVVDFTLELLDVLDRFNAQHDSQLVLRAGIDSGTVSSGLVGQTSMVYDMWGDAVNLAYRVQGTASVPGVYVTQRIVDQIVDTVPLTPAGEVETLSGPQQVWKLSREGENA